VTAATEPANSLVHGVVGRRDRAISGLYYCARSCGSCFSIASKIRQDGKFTRANPLPTGTPRPSQRIQRGYAVLGHIPEAESSMRLFC
jgi:hypothetical protein